MSWQTGNPQTSDWYLVTTEAPWSQVSMRYYEACGSRWLTKTKVLAWQPLPEPYQPIKTREAPPKTQTPWPTLTDGFTPTGIEMMCVRHGRTLLAQDPGAAWDGWLLVRNPEDNGWVSLRKASDWERRQFVNYGQRGQRLIDLARADQEGAPG